MLEHTSRAPEPPRSCSRNQLRSPETFHQNMQGSRVTYRNKNSLDPKYILKKTCPKKNGNTNLLRNKQTTFNKQKRQKFHRHHGPNGPGPRRIVYARKAWLTNEIHGKDGGLRGGEMGGVGWVGWLGWLVGLGWLGLVGLVGYLDKK